jgi:Mg-chelatase subunit ChlD
MPQDASGFDQKPSWDVAIRFQDLKRLGNIPEKEKQRLKKRAIEAVMQRARLVLGSVIKPEKSELMDLETFNVSGQRGEIDILETVEEGLMHGGLPTRESLRFNARVEKTKDLGIAMDASLSMTGEKLALLAVSAAVVALCVPTKNLALMGFDSRTKWIKRFGESLSVEALIERILELPAGGFTNVELALLEFLSTLDRTHKPQANIVLISDGKYTEGHDPIYLASRFKHLSVLKIGKDHAGRNLMQELSAKGNGRFFEARRISDLPRTMYGAIKTLLR